MTECLLWVNLAYTVLGYSIIFGVLVTLFIMANAGMVWVTWICIKFLWDKFIKIKWSRYPIDEIQNSGDYFDKTQNVRLTSKNKVV